MFEHVSATKSHGRVFFGGLRLLGFVGFVATDNWRDDQDAFLAFLHEPPDLAPSVKACNVCGSWLLHRNQYDIAKTVGVEFGHRREVVAQWPCW